MGRFRLRSVRSTYRNGRENDNQAFMTLVRTSKRIFALDGLVWIESVKLQTFTWTRISPHKPAYGANGLFYVNVFDLSHTQSVKAFAAKFNDTYILP
jgi:hypothetical protein